MQTVRVLVRVDPLEGGVLVEVLRQRQLHDVSGAGRVCIQVVDCLVELFGGDVGRQVLADGGDPEFGAVVVFAADVGLRARVVADEDRAESGGDPRGPQFVHAGLEVGEDLVAGGFSIQYGCAHGAIVPGAGDTWCQGHARGR